MKQYVFKVNGEDFSAIVNAKGYATAREPVVAWEMQDLAGETHRVVSRWRYVLSLQLHEIPQQQAAALADQLLKSPLTVNFTSLQTGAEVEAEMYLDELSYGHLLSVGGKNWLTGATLQLRQR